VRHNTPGLFGEVRLAAPPASWVVTLVCLAGLGLFGAIVFGLDVDGQTLRSWLLSR